MLYIYREICMSKYLYFTIFIFELFSSQTAYADKTWVFQWQTNKMTDRESCFMLSTTHHGVF